MYLWTSYPLASALEVLYEQGLRARHDMLAKTADEGNVDYTILTMEYFYQVELTAMLERVANFGQTGNACVLTTRLMDPFCLSIVARKGTLPWLGPNVLFNQFSGQLSLSLSLSADAWPQDQTTGQFLDSSYASLSFHYGSNFAEVR